MTERPTRAGLAAALLAVALLAAAGLAATAAPGGSAPGAATRAPAPSASVPGAATRGPAPGAGEVERALGPFVAGIARGDYGPIDSFLVWKDGSLLVEEYYRGYSADRAHECYSVTKSVTCLLAIAAMGEGRLAGPETPVSTLLPRYAELLTGAKAAITLGHVLTMTAGLEWDEDSTPYTSPRNPVAELLRSSDPVRVVLSKPLAFKPGTRFVYNSGLSHLLGSIVETAVGEPIEAYADRVLFKPLGIEGWTWGRLGGAANSGWGLMLKPRDLAAIGALVAARGSWNGVRVLDPALLERALAPSVVVHKRASYGWQFWSKYYKRQPAADRSTYPLALGWGGQYIVMPDRFGLVIVSTASDYAAERAGIGKFLDELVGRLSGPE